MFGILIVIESKSRSDQSAGVSARHQILLNLKQKKASKIMSHLNKRSTRDKNKIMKLLSQFKQCFLEQKCRQLRWSNYLYLLIRNKQK